MSDKKESVIYSTTNYDQFKYLSGNRKDAERRARKLLLSIKEYGMLVPAIVNERMEIVDGQARVLACKMAEKPFLYKVVPGAGQEECREINNGQDAWRLYDWVDFYADKGNQSYKYLLALSHQFNGFSISILESVASGIFSSGGNGFRIRDEKVSITQEQYDLAVNIFQYIKPLKNSLPSGGPSKTNYIIAIAALYAAGGANLERLSKAIATYPFQLKPAATLRDAAAMLDDCYNYCMSSKNRVRVAERIRDYLEAI